MNASSMRPTLSAARRTALLLGLILALQVAASRASVDDAHSFALQSAEPYVKQGYQVREDYWGGDLGVGEKKAVRQQLFKGNDYWFWIATEVEQAKVSVHIYDADGKLCEQLDSWQKGHFAAAHLVPKSTGSYFVIVAVESSPEERTHWALVYGFR
ncbi:MAG: hypothetical protein M3429_03110 [Verrucomicrobiota bacterium]|nr:hypothetical protein [Verrucomicrobiota bacterium]